MLLLLLVTIRLVILTRGIKVSVCGNHSCADRFCYVPMLPTFTWEAAQQSCRSAGSDLGLPGDKTEEHHKEMLRVMASFGLESVWLSLRKQKYKNWRAAYDVAVTPPTFGRGDGGCGVYYFKDKEVVKFGCFSMDPMTCVCQHKVTFEQPSDVSKYLMNLYYWIPGAGILHVLTIGVICICSAYTRRKITDSLRRRRDPGGYRHGNRQTEKGTTLFTCVNVTPVEQETINIGQ